MAATRKRGLTLLFLALLLAAVSGRIADWISLPPQPGGKPPVRAPDYWVEDFTARILDASGALHYRVRARELVHYPSENLAHLTRPHVLYLRDPLLPWRADAERGLLYENEDRIDLQGKVVMDRDASARSAPLHVVTRDLTLFTDRDYGETAAPVKITRGRDTIDAVGMQAFLGEGRLELLENVVGQYHPQP